MTEEAQAPPPPVNIALKLLSPLEEIERRFIIATPLEVLKKRRHTGLTWDGNVQHIEQGYISGSRLALVDNMLLIYDRNKADKAAHTIAQCELNPVHVKKIQDIIDGVGKTPRPGSVIIGGKDAKKALGRMRVRIITDGDNHQQAYVAFKSPRKPQGEATGRKEYEYLIESDIEHAQLLYNSCRTKIVKDRHVFHYKDREWELDQYPDPKFAYMPTARNADGALYAGHPLQIAEVELKRRDAALPLELPPFIHPDNEVTHHPDSLYSNHHLATLLTPVAPEDPVGEIDMRRADLKKVCEERAKALENEWKPKRTWGKLARQNGTAQQGASL